MAINRAKVTRFVFGCRNSSRILVASRYSDEDRFRYLTKESPSMIEQQPRFGNMPPNDASAEEIMSYVFAPPFRMPETV